MYVEPVTVPGRPLTFQTPEFESGRYVVACIPARDTNGEVQNWTLKQLGDDCFISRLREALPEESCSYYAPTVNAMSGVVLPHTPFTVSYDLDDSHRILRPGYSKSEPGARVPCDGTNIEELQGFLMSAGGCPLVVLNGIGSNGEDVCLAAHAGRDSLIDPLLIRKGQSSRTPGSIIEALVLYAKKRFGAQPEHLLLRSFFSLPYRAFPHDVHDPVYGSINQGLHQFLKDRNLEQVLIEQDGRRYLSLNELIEMQALRVGIRYIDTGLLNLPENGSFAYTTHILPELSGPVRNLVYLRRY